MAGNDYTVSVVGFVFHAGRVLLIRKARPAWQAGRLNGVGGKLDGDEMPVDAMVREFLEETGCKIFRHRWKHNAVISHEGGEIHFFSVVLDPEVSVSNVKNPDPSEPLEWYDWSRLPDDTLHNLRWLIPMCKDQGVDNLPVRVSYNKEMAAKAQSPVRHIPDVCVGKRYLVTTNTSTVIGTVESSTEDGISLTDLLYAGDDKPDPDAHLAVSERNIQAFMRWPLSEYQVMLLVEHLEKRGQ